MDALDWRWLRAGVVGLAGCFTIGYAAAQMRKTFDLAMSQRDAIRVHRDELFSIIERHVPPERLTEDLRRGADVDEGQAADAASHVIGADGADRCLVVDDTGLASKAHP